MDQYLETAVKKAQKWFWPLSLSWHSFLRDARREEAHMLFYHQM